MTKIQKLDITEHDGVLALTVYGKPAICPFRNPVILPHPQLQGQAVVSQPVCNENCQFFVEDINLQKVWMNCCNQYVDPSDPAILQKGIKSGLNQTAEAKRGTDGLQLIKP